MKWSTAVRKIDRALAQNLAVEIRYHRKWVQNDNHWDRVEGINTYDWYGQTCKAVKTWRDSLDEDSHIIDEIIIEEA